MHRLNDCAAMCANTIVIVLSIIKSKVDTNSNLAIAYN